MIMIIMWALVYLLVIHLEENLHFCQRSLFLKKYDLNQYRDYSLIQDLIKEIEDLKLGFIRKNLFLIH